MLLALKLDFQRAGVLRSLVAWDPLLGGFYVVCEESMYALHQGMHGGFTSEQLVNGLRKKLQSNDMAYSSALDFLTHESLV